MAASLGDVIREARGQVSTMPPELEAEAERRSKRKMTIAMQEFEGLRVPDAFTPVVGFRRFSVPWLHFEPYDYLVQRGHRWTPKAPTVARCTGLGGTVCGHAVPAQECGCCLYAWLEVGGALGYSEIDTPNGWVLASVIGWGRVLFDEDFWRAEQAQVMAFADPTDVRPKMLQKGTGAWLERVAANYEVPILPLGELRGHALMYGEEYVEGG
jgi:hypothetical protein